MQKAWWRRKPLHCVWNTFSQILLATRRQWTPSLRMFLAKFNLYWLTTGSSLNRRRKVLCEILFVPKARDSFDPGHFSLGSLFEKRTLQSLSVEVLITHIGKEGLAPTKRGLSQLDTRIISIAHTQFLLRPRVQEKLVSFRSHDALSKCARLLTKVTRYWHRRKRSVGLWR